MATGQFGTIIKPMAHRKGAVKEFQYLQHKDRRMRFNNAQDPIYYIFDCIENRPVSKLAKEFVEDAIFDTMNFISKVVG
ncbi:hypothetical protein IJ674_04130 [bacterium]|nr:hypothetical protein [bacterium]MBR1619065.1 hypothetical protein [bacterium]